MTRRAEFRRITMDIARDAEARLIDEVRLPGGQDMLKFWSYGEGSGPVLVVIDDDSCFHYVQGGKQWDDLKRDLQGAKQ